MEQNSEMEQKLHYIVWVFYDRTGQTFYSIVWKVDGMEHTMTFLFHFTLV